jgi:hypothetical protein
VEAATGPDHAVAEIQQNHSRFTLLKKNDTVLLQ